MSIEAVSAVLHHSQAKGTAKLVLMGIAWHTGADASEGAYPSQSTLAGYANTTVRQVQRCLAQLEELGEIETAVHHGAGYRPDRVTNRYFLRVYCPDNCAQGLTHRGQRDDIKDATGRHLRRNGATFKTSRDGVDVVLKVINN